ncbi:hypothetical protein LTR27_010830 [Elasticomyces elasticus]|nr:hypothetical protein LTR27_010830 [Elasticomyces elasticus]
MADSTGTPPQAWAPHQAALWALSSRDDCVFQMEHDASLGSSAHWSHSAGISNIGNKQGASLRSASAALNSEQGPSSMIDVLAHLVGIQQGIASIDKGMIGIQREIASVKEQVNALPGIFAVLPEFIGREVVSHVETELLEPLGQRISDLEQKFDGLQEVEDKESTEEVSLLHEPTEAPVATFDLNSFGDQGLTEEAPYTPAKAPMLATESDVSEDSFDDTESSTSDAPTFADAEDARNYEFESFPYSYCNYYLPFKPEGRPEGPKVRITSWNQYRILVDAVIWEAGHAAPDWVRSKARALLDREQPGWDAP